LFISWAILTIEAVTWDMMEEVKEVLSWEVEEIEEEEKQTMIGFDITFRDPETQEELQPMSWTVQVIFNYEENENLKQAEEDEEQEIKVYHLNDIDEEGNKIEELTWTKLEEIEINKEESEEWKLVVDAEKFSIYIINNIPLKAVWDTITITYNASWWKFEDWEGIKDVLYTYIEPTEWRKYSHTSNINDDWTLNNSTYPGGCQDKYVITIPWSTKLHINLKYSTEDDRDYLYLFKWEYTWTVSKNMSAWQLYTFNWWSSNTPSFTRDFYVEWDTITFAFYSDSVYNYYWYYATIDWIWWYETDENIGDPSMDWKFFVWWYESWSDTEYDFSQKVTENKTLYAKRDTWVRTIKYNANWWSFNTWNTVTGEIDVLYLRQIDWTYSSNINIQIPDRKAVEWENYSWWMFDWWYTTATNQVIEWGQQVGETTDDEVTVYAKWLPFNDKVITMGDTTFTIMDRNLWATDFSSWYSYYTDQTNLARAWKYYQWWNNYWFRNDVTYQTNISQEQVNLSSYWTWNPYYNNIFRVWNEKWDSSSYMGNQTIWWAYSNFDTDKQWPCPEWYHVPAREERMQIYYSFVDWKLTNEGKGYCNTIWNWSNRYCIPALLWLPLAGWINYSNGQRTSWQYWMFYWSSDYSDYKSYFYTTTYRVWEGDYISSLSNAYWMSVRCFKNTYWKQLIFNTNWGSVNTSINKTYRWYEWWEKLPIPTKTWKIFAWWYRTPDFQGTQKTVNRFAEYESWGSVTLYAKRRDPDDNKTIIFNANWGYFSWWELSKQIEYSEQIESWNYVWNINIQAPNKDFEWDTWWMFDWWYTDTTYTTEWDWVTSDILSWQMVYAKWLPFKDISVTLSWTTITLMDRNLWATVAWWWNTAWSYGKYFQWWNNYWFSDDISNIKTSDFQIDASWYWPGNYYYSNIFIKNSNWWQSWWYWKNNVSLWNWEWPCPKWYHIPSISEWSRLKDLFKSWMASEWSIYCNSLQYTSEWACFSEKLKIPIAWYFSSSLWFTSGYWYYWSTTHNYWTQAYQFADYGLANGSSIYTSNSYGLSNAMSLRCFKDPSTTLTLVLGNWENDLVISWVKRREPASNYKPDEPIKSWYWFEWWYDENWDRFDFSTTYLSESKTLYARYIQNTWYIFDANWWEFEGWNETIEIEMMLSNWKYIPNEIIPKIRKNKIAYTWSDWKTYYTWWMFDWWYTTPTSQTTEWLWQRDSVAVDTKRVYAKWLPFEDLEVTMWWKRFVIMDRNLWAEDVSEWIYWNKDNAKFWHYFQWWNNYGFSNTWVLSNSWTNLVANPNHQASPWWPWNYYYNDKFIKRNSSPYRWDNEDNKNLRWWENTLNSDVDRQWPCPEWYHVPDNWEWLLVYDLFIKEKKQNTNYCTWDLLGETKCLASKLKLPFAGYRNYSDASIGSQWSQAYYQSSTPSSDWSYRFLLNNDKAYINFSQYRTYAFPVRCFKNVSNILTFNPNNWLNSTSMIIRWRDLLNDIKPLKPIKDWYRFLWWYDWDNKFIFSWFLETSKTLDAWWEKNPEYIYNATSGMFESGTEKTIKYLVNTAEFSHTPNIDDEWNQNWNYANYLNFNEVITIPWTESLHITITYWWESCCDWVAMWTWSHPNYTAEYNYNNPKSLLWTEWRLYWWNHTDESNTKEYYVSWDTVTFAYKSDGSSCWDWYWYYAIISDAKVPRDHLYYTNEKISTPTKIWYNLVWWYTWSLDGDNNLILSTESFDITWTEVTEDRILYAKRTPINYSINFHSNTWEDTTTSQVFAYDEEKSLTKNDYIYSWYAFLWWNTEANWSWISYDDEQEITNLTWTDNALIDFYAQWWKLVHIVFMDWDNVLTWYEILVWESIILPEEPTSKTHNFVKWDWLPQDWKAPEDVDELILTAQWSMIQPSAWWGKIIQQQVKEQEHNVAEEKTEEIKTSEKTDTKTTQETIKTNTNTSSQSTPVTKEVQTAYEWAYDHDVTTMPTLEIAMPDGVVKRWHLAKMVVNYAVNVLWYTIPEKIPSECRWNDNKTDWESEEIRDYAVKSCALWLMWLDMPKFLPNLEVTRAQFGTIMSRLLWWKKYAWWTPYYRKHLNALKENNIMTQIENPEKRVELRQWVWLMLMRSAEDK
jgi:hypothetical protein